MKKFPVVIDVETKHTFREFNDPKKLGVTVVALYDYKTNQGQVFTEKEIGNLFPLLENSSYVVGFNNRSFDLPVLQAYYPGKIENFQVFDIIEDVREKLGRRLALNDLITATLGKKKTGHGLIAIDLYKEGRIDELKSYCLDDTLLTKELFDFGMKHGEIYYLDGINKASIKVNWKKYLEDEGQKNDFNLTLPF